MKRIIGIAIMILGLTATAFAQRGGNYGGGRGYSGGGGRGFSGRGSAYVGGGGRSFSGGYSSRGYSARGYYNGGFRGGYGGYRGYGYRPSFGFGYYSSPYVYGPAYYPYCDPTWGPCYYPQPYSYYARPGFSIGIGIGRFGGGGYRGYYRR